MRARCKPRLKHPWNNCRLLGGDSWVRHFRESDCQSVRHREGFWGRAVGSRVRSGLAVNMSASAKEKHREHQKSTQETAQHTKEM